MDVENDSGEGKDGRIISSTSTGGEEGEWMLPSAQMYDGNLGN